MFQISIVEMVHNDIEDVLDQLRRINRGCFFVVKKVKQFERLEMELRFLRTFIKYHHHVLVADSSVKITKKVQLIIKMVQSGLGRIPEESKANLNVERLVSHLMAFVEGKISLRYNNESNDSYLSEHMGWLGKNLKDVLMCLGKFKNGKTLLKQVKIIQKKMVDLWYLYDTKINGYIYREKLEGLGTRIQFMADNVVLFCLSYWAYEDGDDIVRKPPYLLCLMMLVQREMHKIVLAELKTSKFCQPTTFKNKKLPIDFPIHLQSLLVHLRNKKLEINFRNIDSARNIDVAIEFLLVFLADVPNNAINGMSLDKVLKKIGSLVGDIICVIQKILTSTIISDDNSEINLGSLQILEKIENLKAQVEERYYKSFKFIPSQFPVAGGLSFLDSLLRRLNEMLKSESGLDLMMKPYVGFLVNELSSLKSVFNNIAMLPHEHEILNDLQRTTINLAYEAEVAIDSIRAHYNSLWHLFCSLPTIIKEIKHTSVEVKDMRLENLLLKPCSAVERFEQKLTQHHSRPVNDDEIVGFENEAENIVHYLIRGSNDLDVIPIVGMGGQGKTTVARKVYSSDMIVSHFDVRAWCCVSQTYNRRELLQEILSQVTCSKDNEDEVDELADRLRKSLMGKRYVIVLDDLWDGMAWDDLRHSFPDVGNRSRILVTTRLEKVGEQVKHHTNAYSLPFLPLNESCKLLRKKVFQKESPPPKLYDASLAVAEKCKGLPLVIILVAGIIKKKKMEESWWHEVKSSLFSYLGESEEYSLSTMQLSYDNLPDYIRPCLLYMGMFPEDARISVSKLISLWIAEGFVQNIESESLEEAAEGYLMDLISSNVVTVSKRRYNGKVKICQVHDVVLHFCLEKSRKEKFMLAVKDRFSQLESLSYDWKVNRLRFDFTDELSEMVLPGHQQLRALLTCGNNYLNSVPFPQVISKLRLLKVLDMGSLKVDALSTATLYPLIHLKYLAVRTDKFEFEPESILRHLETIAVKGSYRLRCVSLPNSFWKMEKLRRVEISLADFDLDKNEQGIFEVSSKLENLRILRALKFRFDNADSVDVILQKCPNLQHLHISLWKMSPKLESLTQLQSLHLSIRYNIASEFHLPSNLKKLTLTGHCVVSAASLIAELPSLEYLKLTDFYYSSVEWCLGDIMFDKLKVLKLFHLGISRWLASEKSFPILETLVIKECCNLPEIPFSFADIQTLKQIELIGGKKSLVASAVKIREETEANAGWDCLDLTIKS